MEQEQHRRDSEAATARRRRLELEDTVRELEERSVLTMHCVLDMYTSDFTVCSFFLPFQQGTETHGAEYDTQTGN